MRSGYQTRERFTRGAHHELSGQYLLFLPQHYDHAGSKRWPLILFLHGAGERGSNLANVAGHGPPKVVKQRQDLPFIIVSPQCPAAHHWANDFLLPFFDHLLESYRVDPTRVYVTGLSMGGYGTWNLGMVIPERIAAIAPVCGGGYILPLLLAESSRLKALRSLGVWAFHGAEDSVVPVEETERMVTAFKRIGAHPKLTIYPDTDHDSWTETYQNPALYSWFLEHRRPQRPR